MNAENLALNYSTNAEIVEDLSAVLPGIGVAVLSVDLIIESIDGGDLSRFVVASEQGDSFWVLDLQTEQVFEGFDRVVPAINKISDEDIARLVDFSACVG